MQTAVRGAGAAVDVVAAFGIGRARLGLAGVFPTHRPSRSADGLLLQPKWPTTKMQSQNAVAPAATIENLSFHVVDLT